MADRGSVTQKLFDQIEAALEGEENADRIRDLAEAFAWVTNPSQHHGGVVSS